MSGVLDTSLSPGTRERAEDESEDSRHIGYEIKKGKRGGSVNVTETFEGSGLRRSPRVAVSLSVWTE